MSEVRASVPAGYAELLANLKERIQTAQVRASLHVNRELTLLYWNIGKQILERQAGEGWGSKVVERLAQDLHSEFPQMRGLSRTNLLYICGPLPRIGRTKRLSNSLLDEFPGGTMCAS